MYRHTLAADSGCSVGVLSADDLLLHFERGGYAAIICNAC